MFKIHDIQPSKRYIYKELKFTPLVKLFIMVTGIMNDTIGYLSNVIHAHSLT